MPEMGDTDEMIKILEVYLGITDVALSYCQVNASKFQEYAASLGILCDHHTVDEIINDLQTARNNGKVIIEDSIGNTLIEAEIVKKFGSVLGKRAKQQTEKKSTTTPQKDSE